MSQSRYLPFIMAQRSQPIPPVNLFNDNFTDDKVLAKVSEEPIFTKRVPKEAEQYGLWRQTDPFLVDTILDNIFSFLDQPSLLACRRVSRLWCDLAFPFVYAKSRKTLPGPLEEEAGRALLDTMTAERCEGLPMGSVRYQFTHNGFARHTSQFFEQFGVNLRELELQVFPDQAAGWIGTRRFVHIFTNILPSNCPNLKELTISHLDQLCYDKPLVSCDAHPNHFDFTHASIEKLTLSFSRSWNHTQCVHLASFVRQLVSRFPNLKSLTTDFRSEKDENAIRFLKSLKGSLNPGRIEELIFKGDGMTSLSMNILNRIKLSALKRLELAVSAETEGELLNFRTFLEGVAGTLERLVIRDDSKKRYVFTQRLSWQKSFLPPQMPKLREFEMRNFNGLKIEGFGFLNMLPSLRRLGLVDMHPPAEDLAVCPSLNVLGTVACENLEAGAALEKLAKFPNVKALGFQVMIIPTHENLSNLYKLLSLFPNLESLGLEVSFLHKNVMIGDLLRILAKMGRKLKQVCVTFNHCNELRDEFVMKQFLEGLRCLQEFQGLQNLRLVLADLPSMARVMLPLEAMEGMLGFGKRGLNYLHLEGFMIGRTEEETRLCQLLMDSKLSQWSVRERKQSQSQHHNELICGFH